MMYTVINILYVSNLMMQTIFIGKLAKKIVINFRNSQNTMFDLWAKDTLLLFRIENVKT